MGTWKRISKPRTCLFVKPLLILAGPTASGKSALAIALAQRLGGTIINADAMQCYADLRLITARPSPEDEAAAPHALYGIKPATDPATAAWWRGAALAAMESAETPILCGGTGMYFSALIHGLADIPDPGPAARAAARALAAEIGPAALHEKLDPETAATLHPNDSQRITRAYEVLHGTGHGIRHWQRQTQAPLTGWDAKMILLDPPRETLKTAIATRFHAMLAAGALQEVAALDAQNLDPALPLLRAHGVPELRAHLAGNLTLHHATAAAILATQQYTKRQATWFRHQKLVDKPAMHIIQSRIPSSTQFSESFLANLVNFIKSPVDVPGNSL
jgi:tRNA dimethylallyltransferase